MQLDETASQPVKIDALLMMKTRVRTLDATIAETRRREMLARDNGRVMRLRQRIVAPDATLKKLGKKWRRKCDIMLGDKVPDDRKLQILKTAAFSRKGSKPYSVPDDAWITESDAQRWNLHQQRAIMLRRQARIAHLAYGFLLGVPLAKMEKYSCEPPPWDAKYVREGAACPVEALILDHSDEDARVTLQRFSEWKDAAGDRQHPTKGPRWWVKGRTEVTHKSAAGDHHENRGI